MKLRVLAVIAAACVIISLYWVRILECPPLRLDSNEGRIRAIEKGEDFRKLISAYGIPDDIHLTTTVNDDIFVNSVAYDIESIERASDINLGWRWFTFGEGLIQLNVDLNFGKVVGLQLKTRGYFGEDDDIPFAWSSPSN